MLYNPKIATEQIWARAGSLTSYKPDEQFCTNTSLTGVKEIAGAVN